MKKLSLLLASVLLVSSLTVACSANNSQGSEKQSGKTESSSKNESASVLVGIKGPLLSLDPANYRDRLTESVLRNVFDGLVTADEKGVIRPAIAESWENTSPTEWVFKLRKDVKFHDGTALKAEDVKFTFDRILKENGIDGKTSPRKGLLEGVKEVQVVNDYTVKFVLSSPWPILITMLPLQQIIPKAYAEKVGDKGLAEKPIGAGPFKLVKAKLDERIEMVRFDDYYGGAPKIKNLAFDVIPEASSRVGALKTGEVQRIHDLSASLAKTLISDPAVDVKTVEGTRVYMLEMNVQKPPFDNIKVRQAMNHAINMDIIIDKILYNYATRLAGPMLSNAFALDTSLKPYEYNPAKAKELLAEAGYPKGFQVVIDSDANNKEVAEAVAAQLRDSGVEASTRVWDPGVLKPMLLKGERQMFMGDWGNSTLDPFDFLNPKFITKDRGNYSMYSNPRVDELLKQGSQEIDNEKRKAIYKEAQQIIYKDAPWVFGFSKKEVEAGVKALQGWNPTPDGSLYMSKVSVGK
ncbi:ABC transporter substrate-binding protein [Paenibacillus radicis (ex Xue et al. 2023)]|uniref:ABC transporter substrate-binding protein n=1 Tax=Paenibacillus radicis (ex Xue et al. 2023) TaxID=2972489 RepID=A0ABT1YHQ7_9BACL|nr:ABC transporter substrate-binding protein [Paenibacillus radicis (ex Xue et al. 2023)]MCR8632718.1 ABC transporter substrate-binding protein [Paenibacillus radicis (ex Xue et al. 2023)]